MPPTAIVPEDAARLASILAELPDGAEVELGPGRYSGVHLLLSRSLTLRGTGAGVILDGKDGPDPVLVVERGTVKLERCRIVGVEAATALAVTGSGELHLRLVLLADNRCLRSAVLVAGEGKVVLERCTVAGNVAPIAVEVEGGAREAVRVSDSILSAEREAIHLSDGASAFAERTVFDGLHENTTTGYMIVDGDPGFARQGAEPWAPHKGGPSDDTTNGTSDLGLDDLPLGSVSGALAAR